METEQMASEFGEAMSELDHDDANQLAPNEARPKLIKTGGSQEKHSKKAK